MARIGKFLLWFVLGLALALVVGLGFIWLRAGELVRVTLAEAIDRALGTPTQIEKVQLNPLQGQLSIGQINLSNPTGLTKPYFMQISGLNITVEPLSLLQPVVKITNFQIDTWNINVEQSLSRGNISEIVKYVQEKQAANPPKNGDDSQQKKFSSGQVTIGQINTNLRLEFFNQKIDREFNLSNIALKNVTSDNIGAVILDQYITRLVGQTLRTVIVENRERIQQNLPRLPDLPFLKNDPLQFLQEQIDRFSVP
ncbi:MAG: AsmA family protein [Pseudanabaenaceae cyanobacterium SKYGB_i_bin29]|nr:AsmA family protein [Pseudanabaenaceae cyanobacterium SKYG29]MDW8422075.1 AsmA family protein [Pseudanabaenaceae cyanobacterium SKYGB_i_bin29]